MVILPMEQESLSINGVLQGKPNILDLLTRYGYVTNSKVKFVIVVDSSNTSLRDNEIRSVS